MPAIAAQVCNPSYLRGQDGRTGVSRPTHRSTLIKHYLKIKEKIQNGWELEIRWSIYLACGWP